MAALYAKAAQERDELRRELEMAQAAIREMDEEIRCRKPVRDERLLHESGFE
jgi:hypothetical protein